MTAMNLEAAAQSLYGTPSTSTSTSTSTSESQVEKPAQPSTVKAAHGASLYGDGQGEPSPVEDGKQGALNTYAPVARDIESAAAERLGLSDVEASLSASEWAGTFHRYGVTSDDAAHLAEIGIAALVNGVDVTKALEWRNESRDVLASEFGATAALALDDAKRLVASDPALAAWLDETGLGDNPKVVATIARRARHLRNSGSLK